MAVSTLRSLGGFTCSYSSFILEGAPTIIVGVLVWFYLPDFPETAKFLTQDERQLAIDRMGDFAPKGTDKHFDKADFIRTVCAWEFWAFALCYFFMTCVLSALCAGSRLMN